MKTTKLKTFFQNPDNPQKYGDDDIAALVESIRKEPRTLGAAKIAFCTDYTATNGASYAGRRVVIAGNKRLQALQQIAREGGLRDPGDASAWLVSPQGDAPAAWFFDLTPLGPDARRHWLLESNIGRGEWDAEKLLAQFARDELADHFDDLDELLGGAGVKDSDEYGTDFSLPDGEKSEYGQMAFVVTEKQREEINFAVSLAPYCDGFSCVDNTNRNGAALSHIVREWLAGKVKEQRSYKEVEAAFRKLRTDLCAALKASGHKASDVDTLLGTNGMAGHYFGESQFMFPTREAFDKMRTIMPLDGMDYEQCKATEKEWHRVEMLAKKTTQAKERNEQSR